MKNLNEATSITMSDKKESEKLQNIPKKSLPSTEKYGIIVSKVEATMLSTNKERENNMNTSNKAIATQTTATLPSLRDYQVPAFKSLLETMDDSENTKRASVYAATGAGKTVLFEMMIVETIQNNPNAKILIVHPKLALSMDQQARIGKIVKCGMTSFHSGNVFQNTSNKDAKVFRNISTTKTSVLKNIINVEQKDEAHIVFSSYKSVSKIMDLDFDIIIFDEAQALIEPQNFKLVDLQTDAQMYFFTATPITAKKTGSNSLMENVEKFGEVIARIETETLIELGFLVAPRLHAPTATFSDKGNVLNFAQLIGNTLNDHIGLTHAHLVPKLLVTLPCTGSMEAIMENKQIIATLAGISVDDFDLTYIMAGENVVNGVSVKKREVAIAMFGASTKIQVILHCDTLSEGIDIDGMNGALILKTLQQAKFLQTIGRIMRSSKLDLVDGVPVAFEDRIKQFGEVYVPTIDGVSTNRDAESWIDTLRSEDNFDFINSDQTGILAAPTGEAGNTGGGERPELDEKELEEYLAAEIVANENAAFDAAAGGIIEF